MPQTMSIMSRDPEVGRKPERKPDEQVNDRQDGHRDDPVTTSNQPLQGESNFGDSSGPLFSIYTKAAEDEDSRLVERWQKDADGILIFTGLFSAAVAALLSVTVQDLRQNSQDISAFYLGNIYEVLADPNATRSFTPSSVAKPPPFSPSRYAVWVNTLWFLSLLMSLSCALWATSLHQWARRYLRRSQPARCHPEKRARMRAFFAEGVDNMHIPWAVEGLPTLLHFSLFFFFGGVAIFLFNVDREVFSYVVCWIGLFFLVYGMITLLPLIRPDSPYNSPLSTAAWFLYATMTYTIMMIPRLFITFCFKFFFRICFFDIYFLGQHLRRVEDWMLTYIDNFGKYHRRWMLKGVEMVAEEAVSERLSKIDVSILDWIITSLGDDDSLKNFFEAIPGFFKSSLVMHLGGNFPKELHNKYKDALNGFLHRTWTSNSINDSEKLRRLDISVKAMFWMHDSDVSSILHNISYTHWGEVPKALEMGQSLARWCTSDNSDNVYYAQTIIARILASVQERDDTWITLASRVVGLSEQDLRENIAHGDDSVLLAILIHVTRQSLHSYSDPYWEALEELVKLDIRHTNPRLQHDFCTLWNEAVKEARKAKKRDPWSASGYVSILNRIRHHYIILHQGTDAAPTASPNEFTQPSYEPSIYPFCRIAGHHPDPTRHLTISAPTRNVIGPHSSTTTSEIGVTPHVHAPYFIPPPPSPAPSISRPTGTSVGSGGYRDSRGRAPARDAPIAPPRSRRRGASDALEPSSRRRRGAGDALELSSRRTRPE